MPPTWARCAAQLPRDQHGRRLRLDLAEITQADDYANRGRKLEKSGA
jgi:hypothetical protein